MKKIRRSLQGVLRDVKTLRSRESSSLPSCCIGGQYRGTFLVPVSSVKKYRYRSAGTFTSQFLGGSLLGTFAKSFIIKKKSAQLHLPQQSFKRFVFIIRYCHPFKCGNRKIVFHRKRYFEAEEEWSFRVRRPFLNGFVFKMQFRVKVFQ